MLPNTEHKLIRATLQSHIISSKCYYLQTYNLHLILDLCLVQDLYPTLLYQHFIFDLKSYISLSQRAPAIYTPTFFLVNNAKKNYLKKMILCYLIAKP